MLPAQCRKSATLYEIAKDGASAGIVHDNTTLYLAFAADETVTLDLWPRSVSTLGDPHRLPRLLPQAVKAQERRPATREAAGRGFQLPPIPDGHLQEIPRV